MCPAFSMGSPAPMAEILSPLMPMSAMHVSAAVTTVPFRMTVSKRIAGLALNRGFGNSTAVLRKHFTAVDFQRFFFLTAHQVDVELCYAHFAQGFQFFAVLLDGADEAETVDDFVRHKIGVVAADFAVVQVIVFAASLHIRNE